MERAFSAKKEKDPASSSVQDASDRITRRGETIDDKIKKLDAELSRYKEQIKKMRPGPAQEAKKARAMRMLKQKRTYEGQRDMLCSESFKLDQVACAVEGIKDKDAQQNLTSLKYASKDLKGMVKIIKIHGLMSVISPLLFYFSLDADYFWISCFSAGFIELAFAR